LDLLLTLPSDGLTLGIVTHDPDVANACHRRVQLVDGVLE
jgi:predicted ABC-type transport system involved in lysophospholipase L1 biosynthesis ATPase subunit